jgi:Uma2 family endonuclease
LQYWFADVAYIPKADWDALPPKEYPIYAPPLVVEVLSPSNAAAKVNRQRILAMSAGTGGFWVVDADRRTVHVTDLRSATAYAAGDSIPATLFDGLRVPVDEIFAV